MKKRHDPTGNTPQPACRKLRFGNKSKEEEEEAQDREMSTTLEAEDVIQEMQTLRVQTSFLLAQHADSLREKARKEIVVGGWSTFIPNQTDTEKQGEQLEAQTVSRERWIKELAKKAGMPSGFYKEWSFSHQTRGDVLSPITVITVTQPWQRNKLFDFTKKHAGTSKLQERFYINEKEEQDWDMITTEFGTYQESQNKPPELKVQPQISLWDRITGLPLKIGMSIAEDAKIFFKHSWKDLTLMQKDSGEYLLWVHYTPDDGLVTLYISQKNIQDTKAFAVAYEKKFNEVLNGESKTKGKGKGRPSQAHQEKETTSLPWAHSSHARSAKFPFALQIKAVDDINDHWDTWNTLWTAAIRAASSPYTVNVL